MSSVFGSLKIKGFSESFENYFWGLKGLRQIDEIETKNGRTGFTIRPFFNNYIRRLKPDGKGYIPNLQTIQVLKLLLIFQEYLLQACYR